MSWNDWGADERAGGRATRRARRLSGLLAAAVLLLAACGGSPTASDEPDPDTGGGEAAAEETDVYADVVGLSPEELVAAAQEEGQLDLYTSMTPDLYQAITDAFTDAYDIDVNVYRANSETVLQRILQEQQASFQGNDVVETNVTEMVAIDDEGYFTPYEGEPRETVAEAGVFPGWTASRFNVFAPSWNTDLVPAGEEPTSWEDLADPRWEGQISMEIDDVDWFVTLWGYWVEQGKSEEDIEQLFRQMARNSKTVRGHSVQGELMSAGQFAVTVSNYTYIVQGLADRGAPVAYQPLVEPVIARPNGVGLMKNARHPAAALLFTDWILTDGQDVLIEYALTPSVEGKDDAMQGVEVIPVDVETLTEEGAEWSELYQEIIAEGEEFEEGQG